MSGILTKGNQSGSDRLPEKRDVFTPNAGQTVFTLSDNVNNLLTTKVFINGQKIEVIESYTVSGLILTITLPYSFTNNDTLEIYYE